MSSLFKNKVVLITGGTGSFGQAMLAEVLRWEPRQIRIFSRDEKKQDDMRQSIAHEAVQYCLGDVRNYDSVQDAMQGVDYVCHAAALKQVPSCEFYPMEAVRTNVLGTENVLRAAVTHAVQRVVVLSSDKAVYPINAMGMSKALMEKVAIAKALSAASGRTIVSATRFGNAMASRGSVIPLFISQLQSGQPLTITEPHMTRFMASLQDTTRLVIHALEHAQAGDIWVKKSPACTIAVLAQALQELLPCAGQVARMGARHGEKLHESLIAREEMPRAVDLGEHYCIRADGRSLNYTPIQQDLPNPVAQVCEYTSSTTQQLGVEEVKSLLIQLVVVKTAMQHTSWQ